MIGKLGLIVLFYSPFINFLKGFKKSKNAKQTLCPLNIGTKTVNNGFLGNIDETRLKTGL